MKKIILPILLSVIVLCACAAKSPTGNVPSEEPTVPVGTEVETKKTYKATLYFASEDAMYLIPEEREIKYENEEDLPLLIINLLTDGPVSSNLFPVLNKDTAFEGVMISDGVANVTVSENFVSLNSGGSTKEFMSLYSIVNSLCEFDNINSVRFSYADGTSIEEFGSYIIDLPLTKDTTMSD